MDCATFIMCEGIVIEILRRLPAKSLIRFMAVCRLWKTIITSPQFRLHSNRPTKLLVHSADRGFYTLVEEEKQLLKFETDFPLNRLSSATVIGSDNGLVCIRIIVRERDFVSFYRRGIIWNPCIRKHVVIPDFGDDGIVTFTDGVCGFGGTASGGDYKYIYVQVMVEGESLKKVGYIYSLKAGTWRTKNLDDSDITQGMCFGYSCALLRGRLHWVGISSMALAYKAIFSFELEDEVFDNKFMLPESIQSPGIHVDVLVTVIRESLAVITTDGEIGRRHSRTVCVWVMEEYGDVNSWIKLWNIAPEESYQVHMAHLMKDGELLLGFRGIEYPSKPKLVTYNPETMETCDFGGGGSFPSLSSTERVCEFVYKESLVLLADDYHAAAVADHSYPFFWIFCSRVGRVVRRGLRLFICS